MSRRQGTKHGDSTHASPFFKLYRLWGSILGRCYRAKNNRFKYYGGRGIQVCPEWRESYMTFRAWALANGWREGLQIDRIDNDQDYMPGNCRFVTLTANRHNRDDMRWVTAFGETKCVAAWVRDSRCSVSVQSLLARLNRGMEPEKAIALPKTPTRASWKKRPDIQWLTAWGETKSIFEWTRDSRCSVSNFCIKQRLNKGMTPEDAIGLPDRRVWVVKKPDRLEW